MEHRRPLAENAMRDSGQSQAVHAAAYGHGHLAHAAQARIPMLQAPRRFQGGTGALILSGQPRFRGLAPCILACRCARLSRASRSSLSTLAVAHPGPLGHFDSDAAPVHFHRGLIARSRMRRSSTCQRKPRVAVSLKHASNTLSTCLRLGQDLDMRGHAALLAEGRHLQHVEDRRVGAQMIQRDGQVLGSLVVDFERNLGDPVRAPAVRVSSSNTSSRSTLLRPGKVLVPKPLPARNSRRGCLCCAAFCCAALRCLQDCRAGRRDALALAARRRRTRAPAAEAWCGRRHRQPAVVGLDPSRALRQARKRSKSRRHSARRSGRPRRPCPRWNPSRPAHGSSPASAGMPWTLPSTSASSVKM